VIVDKFTQSLGLSILNATGGAGYPSLQRDASIDFPITAALVGVHLSTTFSIATASKVMACVIAVDGGSGPIVAASRLSGAIVGHVHGLTPTSIVNSPFTLVSSIRFNPEDSIIIEPGQKISVFVSADGGANDSMIGYAVLTWKTVHQPLA